MNRRPSSASSPRRAAWLLFGCLCAGCGPSPEAPSPDMSVIRGEPIEAVTAPDGQGEASTSNTEINGAIVLEMDSPVADDGLIMVGFDRLAGFDYAAQENASPAQEAAAENRIPRRIRELDGRDVGVRGFMLPIKMDGGLVREFLLMRDQSMCCFGVVPKINEWVAVTMTGRGVRAMMDQPVTVFGTLRVGEVYEQGVLAGIYRMDGEELAGALDL